MAAEKRQHRYAAEHAQKVPCRLLVATWHDTVCVTPEPLWDPTDPEHTPYRGEHLFISQFSTALQIAPSSRGDQRLHRYKRPAGRGVLNQEGHFGGYQRLTHSMSVYVYYPSFKVAPRARTLPARWRMDGWRETTTQEVARRAFSRSRGDMAGTAGAADLAGASASRRP